MKKSVPEQKPLPTPTSLQHPPAASTMAADLDTPYLVGAGVMGVALLLVGLWFQAATPTTGSAEPPRNPLAAVGLEETIAQPDPSDPAPVTEAVTVASTVDAPGATTATAPAVVAAAVVAAPTVGGGGTNAAPTAPSAKNVTQSKQSATKAKQNQTLAGVLAQAKQALEERNKKKSGNRKKK